MDDKETFRKKLGKHLRRVREKHGKSLKEFEAHDNSIDRHMLSKIETGNRFPTIYTLYKISKTLGIKLSDLFNNFK